MKSYMGGLVLGLMALFVPTLASAQSYYYPSVYPGYNSPIIYSVQPTYPQSYGYQYPQQYNYYTPQYQQYYYQPQYQTQYYYQPQVQYQQYAQPQVQVQVQVQSQQSQSSYYTPQYTSNASNPPRTGSYPTGDKDAIGNQLCYYPSYGTRYSCDSDPHQWVYDYWTGTWY